jgi:hypothetical protein
MNQKDSKFDLKNTVFQRVWKMNSKSARETMQQ